MGCGLGGPGAGCSEAECQGQDLPLPLCDIVMGLLIAAASALEEHKQLLVRGEGGLQGWGCLGGWGP